MSWVRIDDHFTEHPKLASLGTTLPMAAWVHLCALCYCNRHLTDGVFPQQIIASWWPWADALQLDGRYLDADSLDPRLHGKPVQARLEGEQLITEPMD